MAGTYRVSVWILAEHGIAFRLHHKTPRSQQLLLLAATTDLAAVSGVEELAVVLAG